jgi:hypothetical protein
MEHPKEMIANKNMKPIKMKKMIYLMLFLPIVISAQTTQLTALEVFHDTTWEWKDSNNNTFRLKILDIDFEKNTPLDGTVMFLHYKMISNTGEIIYETRPGLINYSGNLPLGGALGSSNEPTPNLYGQIDDYSNTNFEYSIPGILEIVYIPCQGTNCSPQISWKITKPSEIVTFQGAPNDYNLPKDIILTKVN